MVQTLPEVSDVCRPDAHLEFRDMRACFWGTRGRLPSYGTPSGQTGQWLLVLRSHETDPRQGFECAFIWQGSQEPLVKEQGGEAGKDVKGVLSSRLPHVIFSLSPLASGKANHLLEASEYARDGEGRWTVCCVSAVSFGSSNCHGPSVVSSRNPREDPLPLP